MKIYTKTGDDGTTGLQDNCRVSKSHPRILAYGSIDEANAALGVALTNKLDDDLREIFSQIQKELFIVGADLSNPDLGDANNRITPEMISNLEYLIDSYEKELPPLTNFILPGGTPTAAQIHFVRTVIRRAEVFSVSLMEKEKINLNLIHYLNRLSDLFFVLARIINQRKNNKEIIWKP